MDRPTDRPSDRPIGVFDSGVGGLSVLKALRAELPQEDFIYLSDSAHAPYGERDPAHVIERARALTRDLLNRDVKALVVACNTATAAAIHLLRAEHPDLPIVGVEPALKPAVQVSRSHRIGVMATRGTLGSNKFRALLDSLAPQAEFVLQACDGLADAIEQQARTGDGTAVSRLASQHMQALGVGKDTALSQQGMPLMDTIVLGCTHYPFAQSVLQALAGPDVQLIDTGVPVARQTRRLLQEAGLLKAASTPRTMGDEPATGTTQLLCTGDLQALQATARRWLPHLNEVTTVSS